MTLHATVCPDHSWIFQYVAAITGEGRPANEPAPNPYGGPIMTLTLTPRITTISSRKSR